MVVYSCKCLNVQVFGESTQQQVKQEILQTCPLGPKGVVIELVDPGFNFNHKCLVHRERIDQWTVYICVPCHMQTHAVNVKANLLIINADMEVGEEAVQAMKKKPQYSRVFNLVLNPRDGIKTDEGSTGVKLQSHDTMQKQLGDLQAIVCNYLKEEEEAMERRIRQYEVEQRVLLDKLTDRVKQDKTKLVSILFHNSERRSLTATVDNSQVKSHALLTHSKSAVEYRADTNQNLKPTEKQRKPKAWRDSSPDVFVMEEFDVDDAGESSDVEQENSRGVRNQERSVNHRNIDRNYNNSSPDRSGRGHSSRIDTRDNAIKERRDYVPYMSTSAGISLPSTHFRNMRSNTVLEDDIEELAADIDDIPRHMQQLSESIQEHDRYIFGDRPRQRVHTGDFTQVKWK